MEIKSTFYKCAMCKKLFESGVSDDVARDEAAKTFGKPMEEWKDEIAVVCDDCYQKIHPDDHPDEVEEAKKHI